MMYFSNVSRSIVLSLRSGRGVPPRRVTERRERESLESEVEGGARSPRLSCLELLRGRLSFLGDKFVVGVFVSNAPSSLPPVSLRKSFFQASASMSSPTCDSGSVPDLVFPISDCRFGGLLSLKGKCQFSCDVLHWGDIRNNSIPSLPPAGH